MINKKVLNFLMVFFFLLLCALFVGSVQLNWYTPRGVNFDVKTCFDTRTPSNDGNDVICTDTLHHCSEEGDYWVEFDLSEEGNFIKDCRSYEDPYTCSVAAAGYGKLIVKAWNITWDADQADCECYGKNWLDSSRFESGTTPRCCGDEINNEDYTVRVCEQGACSSDAADNACCNAKGDCVYNLICYVTITNGNCGGTDNTCKDLEDASPDFEVCIDKKWQDPDNSREACEEVNNIPRQTKWMSNGVCGIREIGQGDCNDAIPMTVDFCCGDDENELIKQGFDDVCFAKESDCYSYLDGKYYTEREYLGDNICEKGGITTRIKLVALQLLDIADKAGQYNNYTLFCDSYENTLNYYSYQILGVSVTQYLREVNDVCVLKLPEQVIFGASLNKPIMEGLFIDALTGVNNCNYATLMGDGNFHQCNTVGFNSKAWYNNKTQSIIYSRDNIYPLPSDFSLNFWEAFLTFLRNPFQTIFNFLLNLFREKSIGLPGDYNFINSTKKFSRIYLDRKNIKSIMGIAEEIEEPRSGEYISVTYNGTSEDICATVDKVKDKFYERGQLGRKDLFYCYRDIGTGTYYVASNSSVGIALWPELTARLRPR